ncbi:MAG TPA: phosphoribosylformylglycinamidine synthase subunit PurQ [Thermoanaerobaculia bacterium]|jgi:phosphoribosylformylglycinamidine synthase|nr:phosphoribosylformylglycinamidine synthase subunit PurQ [Thermoanaerobaculia bacterium]
MKCGVVVFPGSNCDHDVYHVWKHVLGEDATFLWHDDPQLHGCDVVVLPGGFSYGDYLRAGAMAARSPIMPAIKRHADAGGMVLGVCNGFQILCEAGLLPGAMRRNAGLRFLNQDVHLRVERDDLPYTHRLRRGQVLRMPIAHGEGSYFDTVTHLDALEKERQVVFRYCSPSGDVAAGNGDWNPNGAERAIAGICNKDGNVLALMPHPERCAEAILGNEDGAELFRSLAESLAGAGEGGGRRRRAGSGR